MIKSSPSVLVNTAFVLTMARYNAEMNRRLFTAAARLTEQGRLMHRGAFWGSIHGTLCHLLWGDQIWMSRFDGWEKPSVAQHDSPDMVRDFHELRGARTRTDAGILEWAARVDYNWLQQDQLWFSVSIGRELRTSRGILVVHFFNHQTHHRGQVHAMITAAGEKTGDTDLFLIV